MRFDGRRTLTFRHDPAKPDSLPDNFVSKIFEDRQGRLWIGTINGGLSRYDPHIGGFHTFQRDPENPHSLSDNQVRAIIQDARGFIWVGSWGGGLNRFKPQGTPEFDRYLHNPDDHASLSEDHVCAIYEDRAGNLWIGTKEGLNKCDPERPGVFERHLVDEPHGSASVWTIHEDSAGILWLGTTKRGLLRFDAKTNRLKAYNFDPRNPGGLSDRWVTDIHEDRNGVFWIGTGRGLNRFDPISERFTSHYRERGTPDSLSGNLIETIYEDRGGVLWFGSDGGLNKFSPAASAFGLLRLEAFEGEDDRGQNTVTAISQDDKGFLWLGSQRGLFQIDADGRLLAHVKHDPTSAQGLVDDYVTAVCPDRNGDLWIGSFTGLQRFRQSTGEFALYQPETGNPNSLSHSDVHAILQDSQGIIWIGTAKGLNRHDPARPGFDRFLPRNDNPDSLSHRMVTALHEGRHGVIWVGTLGGLNRLDSENGVFVSYRHKRNRSDSLSHDQINAIHEDKDGTLWLGTPAGLNKMFKQDDDCRFRHFRETDGLLSDSVQSILEDGQGFLWLSANRGLSRFDPRKETFRNYDFRDGLQEGGFNRGAAFKDRTGKLYFGGINGLNAFFPQALRDNPVPPPVALTDFLLFNRPVLPREQDPGSPLPRPLQECAEVSLSPSDAVISFRFAALDFAAPEKNQYAYRLEGMSDEWIYTEADNCIATFTTLPPGRYRFQVKASNKDGVWNETGASLRLRILPPFWRTGWAYGIYILALGCGLCLYFVAHRKKMARESAMSRRLRKIDKLKDDFLERTTHELRAPLQDIVSLAEALQTGDDGPSAPKIAAHLDIIAASAKRMASLVDDLMDSAKLKHGALSLRPALIDLHALTEVVLNMARSLGRETSAVLINAVPSRMAQALADEGRLQQIMLNLVANAIRKTPAGKIVVSAETTKGKVILSVSYSGRCASRNALTRQSGPPCPSIAADASEIDIGLAVAEQLAALHGGRLWTSTTDKGGAFHFTLPLSRAAAPSQERGLSVECPQPLLQGRHELSEPCEAAQHGSEEAFHVLVVDDDPINRLVIKQCLQSARYRVSECANGQEALRALEELENQIHIVLLDVLMPGVTGLEVCSRIRQKRGHHELPVIFLTASKRPEDLISGFETAANDFISKPITKSELLARVKTHLELVNIHRDMDRKVAEKTRGLQELERKKTQFFTNLAHEFRTPLSLIIMTVEELMKGDRAQADRSCRHRYQGVIRQALRLTGLIEQLLDVARLDAGKMAVTPQVIDLEPFVRSCASAFASWTSQKQIDLHVHCSPPSIQVAFDPDKLEKIIYNLLSNALKNTPNGGSVRIRARCEGSWMTLSVKDTGRGIPEDERSKIFDRFSQSGDPEASVSVGIGLALAKELAALHGGDITVQSEVGVGSEFTLRTPLVRDKTFPVVEKSSGALPLNLDSAVMGRPMRGDPQSQTVGPDGHPATPTSGELRPTVLVVEDQADFRTYLSERLASKYVVLEAPNGDAALAIARNRLPELVIADVMMSKMGGFQLCRRLKQDEKTSLIPVLLLTAKATQEDRIAGLRAGADDYVQKPFHPEELLARAANLIESRRQLWKRACAKSKLEPPSFAFSSMEEVFIDKALAAIEQRYHHPDFDVHELGLEMGYSPRQLRRKFTAVAGMGPGRFIREFRMKRAAQLLRQHTGNVSEIAAKVGFRDARHFAAQFRECYGCPPSAFAKKGDSAKTVSSQIR